MKSKEFQRFKNLRCKTKILKKDIKRLKVQKSKAQRRVVKQLLKEDSGNEKLYFKRIKDDSWKIV